MIDIIRGTSDADETQRTTAATLYYAAFRQKLHPIFRDEDRGRQVLAESLDLSHALVAVHDGVIVGIAGFKDDEGTLVDITPAVMVRVFGFFGGWWRLLALALFERGKQQDVLLMDGIVVDLRMRGQGIGSKLLTAIIDYARAEGYAQVRLDVVDTNPRARALYERQGFEATRSESYPFFRRIFGFSGSTTMLKRVV